MAKNKRTLFFISIGVLILAAGVFIALNAKQVLLAVGVSSKPPVFSFDESAAPGWWNTANYNNQANETNGDEAIEKSPVARMNVFKGTKGDGATACFVMYEYYNYAADTDELYDKAKPAGAADITVERLEDSKASIKTPDGDKILTLVNYATSGPGAENSMKGTSYGFLTLSDGYVRISGVCPSGEELNEATKAVSAVSLVRL